MEGRGETHGGEALLLTRKRNNSHRHANRTSIQNARSFLAALSTAIFVPPCLRAILRRDGNLSNRETILASIYKKREKKTFRKKGKERRRLSRSNEPTFDLRIRRWEIISKLIKIPSVYDSFNIAIRTSKKTNSIEGRKNEGSKKSMEVDGTRDEREEQSGDS